MNQQTATVTGQDKGKIPENSGKNTNGQQIQNHFKTPNEATTIADTMNLWWQLQQEYYKVQKVKEEGSLLPNAEEILKIINNASNTLLASLSPSSLESPEANSTQPEMTAAEFFFEIGKKVIPKAEKVFGQLVIKKIMDIQLKNRFWVMTEGKRRRMKGWNVPLAIRPFSYALGGLDLDGEAILERAGETSIAMLGLNPDEYKKIQDTVTRSKIAQVAWNMGKQRPLCPGPSGLCVPAKDTIDFLETFVALGGDLDTIDNLVPPPVDTAYLLRRIKEFETLYNKEIGASFTIPESPPPKTSVESFVELPSGRKIPVVAAKKTEEENLPSLWKHSYTNLQLGVEDTPLYSVYGDFEEEQVMFGIRRELGGLLGNKRLSWELMQHFRRYGYKRIANPKLQKELEQLLNRKIFYETEGEYKASSHYREGIAWYEGMTLAGAQKLIDNLESYKKRLAAVEDANKRGGLPYQIVGEASKFLGNMYDPFLLVPSTKVMAGAKYIPGLGKNILSAIKSSAPTAISVAALENFIGTYAKKNKGYDVTWQEAGVNTALQSALGIGGGVLTGLVKNKLVFKNTVERDLWSKNKELIKHRLDADGNITLTLGERQNAAGVIEPLEVKLHFGKESADGHWLSLNDMFKHVSVDEIEKSLKHGLHDANKLHKEWFDAQNQAIRSASPGGSLKKMQVASQGRINGYEIHVLPDGTLTLSKDGVRLTTFNQRVTPIDQRDNGPTAFSNDIKKASESLHGKQKIYPNSTWDNIHAEFSLMQQAYRDGLIPKGGTMEIVVVGKKTVCDDCQLHLPIMAEKTGLRFLTVVDKNKGVVYYWQKGMTQLEELSVLPT